MGAKDITQKHLEDFADVFADIVNVLLGGGERKISGRDLVPAMPRSIYKASGDLREHERDCAKIWRAGGADIALLGMENQEAIDGAMPMRVIGYDGADYQKRLADIEAAKRANRSAMEAWERNPAGRGAAAGAVLRPVPEKCPVVSIVLYFGLRHWKKPRRLSECFHVPEWIRPYFADYAINVFEIAWLDDTTVGKFVSDFRFVARVFTALRKRRTGECPHIKIPADEVVHMREVLELISAVTRDKAFKVAYNRAVKEGGGGMINIVDELLTSGREEGMEKGREEGRDSTYYSLVQDGDLALARAAERLGITVGELSGRMLAAGYSVPATDA